MRCSITLALAGETYCVLGYRFFSGIVQGVAGKGDVVAVHAGHADYAV